jgi:soluble lytic murein transglycosylase-like protein
MNKMRVFKAAVAGVMLICASSGASAFDLENTLFGKAARQYGIDPRLLYSVALVESASGRGAGTISPWPWTLRAADIACYARSKKEAEAKLALYQQKYGHSIDIGMMQINLHWHGSRVDAPERLLEPETNVMLGAQLLAKTLQSAPHDLVLGIGRYHSWKDEAKARHYGRRVLAVYQHLNTL